MLSESFPVGPREEREPPGREEKGRGCAMNITVWVQLWEPRGGCLPWRSGRDLGRLHRGGGLEAGPQTMHRSLLARVELSLQKG